MKRYILTLVTVLASFISINAMSYEEAREEALYLTDKMAYELNLNEEQYEYAYEINLDYLMGLRTSDDIYGAYLSYRNADLRAILYDWQWTLFTATDYFYHPVYWRNGGWYYPIYNYYHHNHFYFDCPSFYYHYHGGHGHYYYSNGFYTNRRPSWHGGYRGSDRGHFGGIRDSHRAVSDYRGGGRHNNFGGISAGRGGNTNMGTRGGNRNDMGGRPGMSGNRNENMGNRNENMGSRGGNRGGMNSSTRQTMADDVYGRGSGNSSRESYRERGNNQRGGSYGTPSTTTRGSYSTPSTSSSRGNYSTPSRGSYSTPSASSSRGSYGGSSSSRGSMGSSAPSTRSSSGSSFGGGSSRGSMGGGSMSSGSRGHSGRGGR